MTKDIILQNIVAQLTADLSVISAAAQTAHQAATHEECLPDNKYDTTALEASYIAQGQANRAQEIREALDSYRVLKLQIFQDTSPIRLTALITIEGESGALRRFFLGPRAGGMRVADEQGEVVVITPSSPLGRSLLGLQVGDEVQAGDDTAAPRFTITEIC